MNDTETTASPPVSNLADRLAKGGFVMTTEISPPIATETVDFVARAMPLRGLATAVNVTDGAGARAHLSSVVAAHALALNGIEPILQLTCRDRNRIALQGDLLGAMALGIHNVLALSGDDPKAGDQPETKPVFDLDSRGLLAMAQQMRSARTLPPGTAIKGPVRLLLGAADSPIDPPVDWVPKSLIAKVEAGADFIQTQFCMDVGIVRRYAARLTDLGIAERLKILIGVCPIPSGRSARWMREKLFGTIIPDEIVDRLDQAADPKREGQQICVEIIHALAATAGIAGVHIMAPQNPSVIPDVIRATGLVGHS